MRSTAKDVLLSLGFLCMSLGAYYFLLWLANYIADNFQG